MRPRIRLARSGAAAWRRPWEASVAPSFGGHAGAARCASGGFTNRVLEKRDMPRHTWMKEVDQAPEKANIRRQKELYLRERGAVYTDLQGLLSNDEEAKKAVKPMDEKARGLDAKTKQTKEDVNEALRMYRTLRPDAPPFFEEDAQLSMQAKANRILTEEGLQPFGSKYGDPFQAYLPVVNPNAFLVALESVVASLADDVETMCLLAGLSQSALPKENDPLRFKKLVDALFNAFPLKKDPGDVDRFMDESWDRLRSLLPRAVAELEREKVAEWLRGHLRRVSLNQQRLEPRIFVHQAPSFKYSEWYNFAEDFPYDDDPMPADLIDERNLDFPLEQAEEFMRSFLGALADSPVAANIASSAEPGELAGADAVASQFQDFVWDLEKVGLRNWLRMDVEDLERYLPKGDVGAPRLTEEDVQVAKVMLQCAARDRANLLDFDAVDPLRLLHDLPPSGVMEQLAGLPAHAQLPDSVLNSLVEGYAQKQRSAAGLSETDKAWLDTGATVDQVFQKELDFYRNGGPVEWKRNGEDPDKFTWRWREPANTIWDKRRQVYIPMQNGVDPKLDLKELRQHMLDVTRMGSMSKDGRVNYWRVIVVVGNGKGIYGFGVGFGNTPKEGRSDAAIKAMQNLDYIDTDTGRMYPFPVRASEYTQHCHIVPRPIGRGIKCRKKFYPLAYILGLDNCKFRFPNWGCRWFTRVRAIRRTLEMLVSRRTLANMTGKKHALLVAPGDHWVHWPDRWFEQIRKPYDEKAAWVKLSRRHALRFKKRGNTIALAKELKPGWRKNVWSQWATPLEKWVQDTRHNPMSPRELLAAAGGGSSGGSSGAMPEASVTNQTDHASTPTAEQALFASWLDSPEAVPADLREK